MKHWGIGKRLIVTFILVSLIGGVSGVLGLSITLKTDRSYSQALIIDGFSQGEIGQFNTYLNKGAAVVRDIIFLTEEAELRSAQQQLETLKTQTLQSLAAMRVNCPTDEEQALLAVIDQHLPLYQTAREEVISLGLSNQNEAALTLYRAQASPHLDACMEAAQALADRKRELGDETSERLSAQSSASVMLILLTIAASLAASIALGAWIARSISRPIQACSQRLHLLAAGDLHSPVPQTGSRDEVGQMLEAMKTTVEGIDGIIGDLSRGLALLAQGDLTIEPGVDYLGDYARIRDSMFDILTALNQAFNRINLSAMQVSKGSEQVSSGAQALAQGATEQASSVEELAAALSEISAQVNRSAQAAGSASAQAANVNQSILTSNQRMQEMVAAMTEIDHSSGKIVQIIKTIEDIAFQTNILALNAAVEAARAGEAGKGFAVVAGDVRSLAAKSADASKDTATLIEGTLKAVHSGANIASDTAQTLTDVVEGVQQVTSAIGQITTASADQAQSLHQVNQGVEQISQVVQTNSATAQQGAASSQELSGQAQLLKELVARFRLRSQT